AFAEAVEVSVHTVEGVLGEVDRIVAVPDVAHRHPDRAAHVELDEGFEVGVVTVLGPGDQPDLFCDAQWAAATRLGSGHSRRMETIVRRGPSAPRTRSTAASVDREVLAAPPGPVARARSCQK